MQVLDITLEPPHNIDLDLLLVVFRAFWAHLGVFLAASGHILGSKTGPKTRQNGDLIQGPSLEPKLLENGPQNGPRMAPKVAPKRYLGGFLGFRRPALSLLGPALLATWLSRGLLGTLFTLKDKKTRFAL